MSVHFNFLIALSLQNLAPLVRIHSRFPERRTTAVATQEEKRQDESQTILALLFFFKITSRYKVWTIPRWLGSLVIPELTSQETMTRPAG
jgi:hypothetical protein